MEEENIEEKRIKSFIGNNANKIYSQMQIEGSFNIYCMLFSTFYFMYRKMYLVGTISFAFQYVITNFIENNVLKNVLTLAVAIICGFIFYPLYKSHINRKLKKLDLETVTEEQLNRKGGTSISSIFIIPVILIVILISSTGMYIYNTATNSVDNENNISNESISKNV